MNLKCKICGDEFTVEDMQELYAMHEDFFQYGRFFICPDCWDNVKHQNLEDFLATMMGLGDE